MVNIVNDATLNYLKSNLKSSRYDYEGVHCYQKLIPHVAFVLLKGKAYLNRKNQSYLLPPGAIWGIEELMQQKPSAHDVLIKAGTEIISLDRSTILQFEEVFKPFIWPLGA